MMSLEKEFEEGLEQRLVNKSELEKMTMNVQKKLANKNMDFLMNSKVSEVDEEDIFAAKDEW